MRESEEEYLKQNQLLEIYGEQYSKEKKQGMPKHITLCNRTIEAFCL